MKILFCKISSMKYYKGVNIKYTYRFLQDFFGMLRKSKFELKG